MLKPAFTINLNEKLLPGLVSVGKFDGLNPCIVAATSSDKVSQSCIDKIVQNFSRVQ